MASTVRPPATSSQSEMQVSLHCYTQSIINISQPKSSNYNPSVHGRRTAFVHGSWGESPGVLDTIFTLSS